MPVDDKLFRAILGSFPTGVAIVTALSDEGLPRGLTTNAITSVSARPPLMLVCVEKRSQTLPAIVDAGAFVVNFLEAGREALSRRFATKAADKFVGLVWTPSAVAKGAPIFGADSIAYAECLVVQAIDAGDHTVFLASIEGGEVRNGLPLMHFRRGYAAWPWREAASVQA
jgi:flavin-dependent trigonelline monooxygenase, reductase component